MDFRSKQTGVVLEAKAEGIRAVPIDEQEIVATVAVDVEHLHRFQRAAERNLLRLGQGVITVLRNPVDGVLRQQDQPGALGAGEVAGGQGVGGELAILDLETLGRTPAVGALIVLDDKFLRLAVVGDVGAPVAVEILDDERSDALFAGDGVDAEPGVGRKLVQLALRQSQAARGGQVGLAGLVVEQRDLRARVVDDDEIIQAIAIQVGGAQLRDEGIDGKCFRPGEAKIRRSRAVVAAARTRMSRRK